MDNYSPRDEATQSLLDYCQQKSCFISPKIQPHRFPHSGLGIRAFQPVQKGQELMHVPSHALLTPASVPGSFIAHKSRKNLKVHALLAAYLAFCPKATEYAHWMSSWPRLHDFRTGMPVFWPASAISSSHHFVAPSTQPPPASSLQEVTQKYETDLAAVARLLPHLSTHLCPSSITPEALRFQHMWACVNTRCFYYVLPGQQPPSDTNEAMALCPGMDLFNHASHSGCKVRYDKTGFYVSADRDYSVGEELLLCYGSHSNEALWVEYGFMLGSDNVEDFARIDEFVLQDESIGAKEKGLLEEMGYWGRYEIRKTGVCWRTEVGAWCCALTQLGLSEDTLRRLVDGTYDPSKSPMKMQQENVLRRWVKQALRSTHRHIGSLHYRQGQPKWTVVDPFGDSVDVLRAVMKYDTSQDLDLDAVREKQAFARNSMCVGRWQQIQSLFESVQDELGPQFDPLAVRY